MPVQGQFQNSVKANTMSAFPLIATELRTSLEAVRANRNSCSSKCIVIDHSSALACNVKGTVMPGVHGPCGTNRAAARKTAAQSLSLGSLL